ncbi:hypothetical protein BGZ73_005222 [Actinomortierella ambigua]|nr:hypothetical protein BGZ73_005222 [Actinomortierella ambigua]
MPAPLEFHVLIVGAGLGGCMLGALLERAGVSYTIFERAKQVKPLGSAIALTANALAIFEQLGLYEELRSFSSVILHGLVKDEAGKLLSDSDYTMLEERYGYPCLVAPRPLLYDLLLRQIPRHKILFNKRVLTFQQNHEGVMVRVNDNTTYHGNVLVGADGAYSPVRQCLYKQLRQLGRLRKSDVDDLPFKTICLVGTTRPMSRNLVYPNSDGSCRYECTVADNRPILVAQFLLADNSVAWMVNHYIGNAATRNEERFRNSEWGPEAADQMAADVGNINAPLGGVIGDYIKNTPSDLISKVMLEEKMFDTWYHGRTVLLGDACHKMFPAAGQGAVNAIQDACVLANVLVALPSNRPDDILRAFKAYKSERLQHAKVSFDSSVQFGKLLQAGTKADIYRFLFKRLPRFLWLKQLDTMFRYSPQVSFLPPANPKGTVKPLAQRKHFRPRSNSIASSLGSSSFEAAEPYASSYASSSTASIQAQSV